MNGFNSDSHAYAFSLRFIDKYHTKYEVNTSTQLGYFSIKTVNREVTVI